MNIYLAWAITILYGIAYPIYYILYWIYLGLAFIIQPLCAVLLVVLQPVIYLAFFLWSCLSWPLRFAARFEASRPLDLVLSRS